MKLHVPVLGEQRGNGRGDPLLTLGSLVPGGVLGAVHVQGADVMQLARLRRHALHKPALQLQEPDQDSDLGVISALEHALGLAGRWLVRVHRRVARRHQHAELEPDLVLLRGLVIGVQQITLEQDRVRHPASVIEVIRAEPHGDGSSGSAASSSSASTADSHVGSALRALNRSSSSMAVALSRIQLQFGKCASIASRHTLIGSR